jgi:hypothetical protein
MDFVSNDTASVLRVTCVDANEERINLAGASANLHWKDETGQSIDKAMTIEDAANGVCTYQFGEGELFSPGMSFEVEITDVNEKKLTNVDLIAVTVRKALA